MYKMKEICLAGFSFKHNYGDVLMFTIYVQWLNQQNIIPYLYQPCERLQYEINSKLLNYRIILAKEEISKNMIVIFIGGGYFGITEYYQLKFQYNFIKKNRLYLLGKYLVCNKIDFHILGVEVGPGLYPFALYGLKPIIQEAKTVVVRNVESKNQIDSFRDDIEVLPDVVFAQNGFSNVHNEKIALHLSSRLLINLSFIKTFHLAMIQFCKVFSKKCITVFFDNYLLNSKQELRFANLLDFYEIRGISLNIIYYHDIDTIDDVLNENSFIITNKLHCGIRSLCHGNYTICVGSGPKLARMYNSVQKSDCYLSILKGRNAILTFLTNHYANFLGGKTGLLDKRISCQSNKYREKLIKIVKNSTENNE